MIGYENLPNAYIVSAIIENSEESLLLTVKTTVLDNLDEEGIGTWFNPNYEIKKLQNVVKVYKDTDLIKEKTYSNIEPFAIQEFELDLKGDVSSDIFIIETYNYLKINDLEIYGPSKKTLFQITGEDKLLTFPNKYLFKTDTQETHYGPFHFHQEEDGVKIMEGSYHVDGVVHSTLEIREETTDYSKLSLLDNGNKQPILLLSANSANLFPPIVNKHYDVNDGKISFFVYLNELRALENTTFNRILLSRNREFFLNQKDKIEIKNFEVSYFSTTSKDRFNSLDVKTGLQINPEEFSVVAGVPEEDNKVSNLKFENYSINILESQITNEMQNNFKLSATIEKVDVLNDVHLFKIDHHDAYLGTNNRRYRTKITFKNNLKQRLINAIEDLETQLVSVKDMYNQRNNKKTLFGKLIGQDFIKIHNDNGYELDLDEANITRTTRMSNSNSNRSQAYWVKIPELVDFVESYLKPETNGMFYFNILNPITGDVTSYYKVIEKCEKMIFNIKKLYDLEKKFSRNSIGKNLIGLELDIVEAIDFETVELESPSLKSKFLPTENGMITKHNYLNRVNQEYDKFFVAPTFSVPPTFTNIKKEEKASLQNLDNRFHYFAAEEIKNRNVSLRTLDNSNEIFQFDFFKSLKKEIKTQKTSFVKSRNSKQPTSLKKVKSSYKAKRADARNYLGSSSPFLNINKHIKEFKNVDLSREMELDDNISEFKRGKSAKFNIQKFNPESDLFPIKRNKVKEFKLLPPQVKAIMLSTESNITRFPLLKQDEDPLKNVETRESIKQNFLSIKKTEYLEGFGKTEGFANVNDEVWKPVTNEILNDDNTYICRLVSYENKLFGIESEKNLKTEDKFFILRK